MADIFEALSADYENAKIMACGLVLPPEQQAEAIDLSRTVAAKFPLEYVLDDRQHLPFLRLYETVFPDHNVDKVVNAVKNLAVDMSPLPMQWGSL